jgi:hypothetical protein
MQFECGESPGILRGISSVPHKSVMNLYNVMDELRFVIKQCDLFCIVLIFELQYNFIVVFNNRCIPIT